MVFLTSLCTCFNHCCLLIFKKKRKLWYIDTTEYYSAMRRNKPLIQNAGESQKYAEFHLYEVVEKAELTPGDRKLVSDYQGPWR